MQDRNKTRTSRRSPISRIPYYGEEQEDVLPLRPVLARKGEDARDGHPCAHVRFRDGVAVPRHLLA